MTASRKWLPMPSPFTSGCEPRLLGMGNHCSVKKQASSRRSKNDSRPSEQLPNALLRVVSLLVEGIDFHDMCHSGVRQGNVSSGHLSWFVLWTCFFFGCSHPTGVGIQCPSSLIGETLECPYGNSGLVIRRK
ncbi:hypothetical protein PanWU01x14_154960 [Parasponia andersonii]|uniref:Uncharacterized protein n=1 Tax=Parasponia andersonii TaxID=3476 RepID=A0A2P5CGK3_PARAD|nr:hypothetical protein PanWU01x14_154960 [Parasponia andersonii]